MARSRPPSFDFYVDDFVAGTMVMHPLARGIYISLLCHQWNNGSVPPPESKRLLTQITGALSDELDEHIPSVFSKFQKLENGSYCNARLANEYQRKIEICEKRQEIGRLGGRPNQKVKQLVNQKGNQKITKSGSRKKEVGSKDSFEKDSGDEWKIPDGWDTPELRNALSSFEAMRVEKKKPIRNRSNTSKIFKQFDSVDHLIYALDYCTGNEYQGLNPQYRPPIKLRKPASETVFTMDES